MSLAEHAGVTGCPGCAANPSPPSPTVSTGDDQIELSVPGIRCAGCIATVEGRMLAIPGVAGARVNLGQKRVRVTPAPGSDLAPEVLIDALSDAGFEAHALDAATLGTAQDDTGRALLMRVAVSGFAMMNVMLLSVAIWSGAEDATRTLFHWLSALIALPAVAFAAQPFLTHALGALRAGRLNMDVPISLAILLACGMSLYETAAGGRHAYFDAALSLTFFLLVGRYLDHRSRLAARSAVAELSALEVPRVIRLRATGRETVDLADIAVGDRVLVPAGARIPVDGDVVAGQSDIDRALMTGESLPVVRGVGDTVSAGEGNISGPLTLVATAVGGDTALRRMVSMIDAAESARNRYTALADRAAAIYAPAVHLLALLAFAGWMMASGDLRLSLNIAIAVLIITCPCALGLAVPAVSTAAAGALFRRGLLVKDGTALERLAEIDTVVFDKTGTLTDGVLRLDDIDTAAPDMAVALGLAQVSTHPVARAIAAGLAAAGVEPAMLDDIREHPGAGIEARWNATPVRLGAPDWVGGDVQDTIGSHLRIGAANPIALPLGQTLRTGAVDAVATLRDRGIDIAILSGDRTEATQDVAARLGIAVTHAGMSPADKVAFLQGLADAGKRVLMVGDGLNDTGALATAWASASPASAADAARAASDVVLLGGSLAPLPGLLRTARSARARVRENFAIAAGYNCIAVPIALAGFATPLMAAIAMSTSSITVLLNALRVRR